MKLHNSPTSPFGARVAIALRAKGIDYVDIGLPETGLKSPEFLAVNPVGKVPVLLTESGLAISESEVILDYLDTRFPTPALLPADPEDRARLKLVMRMTDTYVTAPIIRTFPHLDPSARNETILASEIAYWKSGLAALAHFLREPLPRADAGLTMADCMLAPAIHLGKSVAPLMGLEADPSETHPELVAYYRWAMKHPVIGPLLEALSAAQARGH